MGKKIGRTVILIVLAVCVFLAILFWAISLFDKPAAEKTNTEEAYVYRPTEKTEQEPQSATDVSGKVVEPVSEESVDGDIPAYVDPQSVIANAHEDQVEIKNNIPLTHTEWIRTRTDMDIIYNEVESYAAKENLGVTEIEILEFDGSAMQYQVELYPSKIKLRITVN